MSIMASASQIFTTVVVRRADDHFTPSTHFYVPLSTAIASASTYPAQLATSVAAIPGPGAIDVQDTSDNPASGTPYTSRECGLIAGIVLSLVALIVILVELAIVYWRVQERRMGSRGRVPKIRWRSPRLRELELEEARKKLKQFNFS